MKRFEDNKIDSEKDTLIPHIWLFKNRDSNLLSRGGESDETSS